MYQLQLGGISPEQEPLPEFAALRIHQPPLVNSVPAAEAIDPSQLSFGPNQDSLRPTFRPQQLALLAEPAVWEADAAVPSPPRDGGGRLTRRRTRGRIGSDQMSLF